MQKIFLAVIYLVSLTNILSAADILSCQSETKFNQIAWYDQSMTPVKRGECRDPYMTTCYRNPDATQHYDIPVSSLKATDLEYSLEASVPGSEEDDETLHTPPTQVLFSVNRTDGSFVARTTKPWGRLRNHNEINMQMDAIRGPIAHITEYTGHCELKHVETKF